MLTSLLFPSLLSSTQVSGVYRKVSVKSNVSTSSMISSLIWTKKQPVTQILKIEYCSKPLMKPSWMPVSHQSDLSTLSALNLLLVFMLTYFLCPTVAFTLNLHQITHSLCKRKYLEIAFAQFVASFQGTFKATDQLVNCTLS